MPRGKLFRALYRHRVRAGLLAFLACLVLARPTWTSLLIGIPIGLLGLLIRLWASGHIRKEKELAISGPYRYSRNPLYFGNFILGISLAACANSPWVAAIFAAYFLVFYPVLIITEHERMKNLFPEKYREYQDRVPVFFPFRKPMACPERVPFRWELCKTNREYRALLGALVYWAILTARILARI